MSIDVNVTSQPISATVAGSGVSVNVAGSATTSVTVTGGFGPTGPQGDVGPQATLPAGSEGQVLTYVSGKWAAANSAGNVLTADPRLFDAREWTAITLTQAEAEAGTSTTRRAWTAQRVFQAIAAWWAASASKTKLDGIATGATANATNAQLRDRATHTGTQPAATITGLAAVATSGSASDITSGTLPASQLPQATKSTLGGVIVGSGLTVSAGTISTTAHTHTGGQVTIDCGETDMWSLSDTVTTAFQAVESVMAGKADAGHVHDIEDVAGLQALLENKASAGHAHGNLTNAGTVGTTADRIVVTAAGGSLATATIGSGLSLSGGTLTASGGGGTPAWSDITGKPTTVSGFGITDAVVNTDSRLTDSREWVASTIAQAEAEAGTATTRRAWTAERVRQAIVAWWTALSVPVAKVTGLQAALDAKSPIDSPQFTNDADAARFTDDVGTVTSISGGFLTTRRVTFENDTAGVWQTTAFTGTLKTKLDGIATGATANATDAALRDRATHTGTQAAATITGLAASATVDTTNAANISSGTLAIGRIPTGTTSTTVCVGNDARLSDSRSPTPHASAHAAAGADPISVSDLQVITTVDGNYIATDDSLNVCLLNIDNAIYAMASGKQKAITSGTAAPSGGSDGDIYLQYT